jgi:formylglycine-generating enzyme required for sulfatase activity
MRAKGVSVATDVDMVWIPQTTFRMGSDRDYPEERPVHRVSVDGFWIDRTPVTNASFARFVAATRYTTTAETATEPWMRANGRPGVPFAGSLVFARPLRESPASHCWRVVSGADWLHPFGPDSTIEDRAHHPVVHVTYQDAIAFASWAGKDLPTEAEWECAARGGLDGAPYAWGDEWTPGGRLLANTWQGEFPWLNRCEDGWDDTSPVDAFPPNGYGVYDMIGNAWEWTSDWFLPQHPSEDLRGHVIPHNPTGGLEAGSYDPDLPTLRIPRKVLKGGSYLSAPNYCRRYRPSARVPEAIDLSACHLGFRCIVRPAQS